MNMEENWNSQLAEDIRNSIIDGSYKFCIESKCPKLTGLKEGKINGLIEKKNFNIHDYNPSTLKSVKFNFDQSCNLQCPSCRTNKINYIWTKGNVSDQYSRSFVYNFGVKYGNHAKYYLLHDLDVLVKSNFFDELYENIGEAQCMQTYGKRRILYLSEELTKKVKENIKVDWSVRESTQAALRVMVRDLLDKYGSIVSREFMIRLI
jgi:hypothetical protein